jgi:hypothetical protein
MRMAEAGVSICNRNRIMTGLRSPRAVSTIVLATIRSMAATLIPDIPRAGPTCSPSCALARARVCVCVCVTEGAFEDLYSYSVSEEPRSFRYPG